MSKKNYSTTKSQFIQSKMSEGRTNAQARKDWDNSAQKDEFEKQQHVNTDGNVEDEINDEWAYYAGTAEDL